MAECYQLTIYEPDVNPRTVNLLIDSKDIETVRCPVFNEDGSLVRDYTVVTEDSDTEDGTRVVKDNGKECEANLISKSEENCIQVSENVHNFLSGYQMNSSKKEKKINRFKQIKEKLDAKKLKNKLKKQKNKMRKNILTNNTQIDGSFNFNIGNKKGEQESKKITWKNVRANINNSFSPGKLTQDNENNLIISNWKNKNQTERISQRKKKKQRKKNKAGFQNSQVADQSITTVDVHSCTNNQQMNEPNDIKSISSQSNAESLEQVTTQSTSESASDFIPINPHSLKKYPFFCKSKISTAWNAKETAPDFIPIDSGPRNRYSFQKTHSNRPSGGIYGKFKFQLSQHNERVSQCENEFMGISQKAFFLQC